MARQHHEREEHLAPGVEDQAREQQPQVPEARRRERVHRQHDRQEEKEKDRRGEEHGLTIAHGEQTAGVTDVRGPVGPDRDGRPVVVVAESEAGVGAIEGGAGPEVERVEMRSAPSLRDRRPHAVSPQPCTMEP